MSITENEAREKLCCAAMSGPVSIRCYASQCMAWRWNKPPRLQFTQRYTLEQIARLRNLDVSHISDIKEADAFMRESLQSPQVLSATSGVTSDWVCTHKAAYDDEEGIIFVRYSRAIDETATGHCGLVNHQPPTPAPDGDK